VSDKRNRHESGTFVCLLVSGPGREIPGPPSSRHGTSTHRTGRHDLPRERQGSRWDEALPRRRRPPVILQPAHRSSLSERLVRSGLLAHDDALPPDPAASRTDPEQRFSAFEQRLRTSVQPSPRPARGASSIGLASPDPLVDEVELLRLFGTSPDDARRTLRAVVEEVDPRVRRSQTRV
jgi:hypothetical protein